MSGKLLKSTTVKFIVGLLLLLAALYYIISYDVYRFRHPKHTQTESVLNIVDVLLWR